MKLPRTWVIRSGALVVLGLLAVSSAMAIITTGPKEWVYDLTLPTFTGETPDGGNFNFEFDWLGALQFNAPPNSSCPLGCPLGTPGTPEAGFSYSGMSFTSADPTGCGAGCAEVLISFSQAPPVTLPLINRSLVDQSASDLTLTFTLLEPDSFWSTMGFQNFANNQGNVAIGAGYAFSGGILINGQLTGQATSEIGCSANCSVDTSTVPEPGSPLLMLAGLTGLAGLMAVIRRRLA